MAIITKIRTRAGVLVTIIIGLALFAFILTDFLTSGSRLYNKARMNIAEINGKTVEYPLFEKRILRMEEIMKTQYGVSTLNEEMVENVRNQAWQDLLQEYVMTKEYDKLGLSVGSDELFDQIEGPNPHPIIRQLFGNPETGAVNRVGLNGFLQKMKEETDSEQKRYWLYIEDMIYKQCLLAKYSALVRNGLYATKLEAETRRNEISSSVDFSYIQKPYTSLSDSSVSVNESELKAYYKEHKEEYKQVETRTIQYVAFDIIPSESDNVYAKKWINDILSEYIKISDVEQYIKLNSDEPYDRKNYKKGELPERLDGFMFAAKVGDIMGPYFENNAYKIAKLAKINYMPDSVRVTQIVLPVNQKNLREMQSLADSLRKLAQGGHDFTDLVKNNSNDPSAKNGGDIGWIKEGFNGPQFSDSCFYAKKGEIKLTVSQSGFHIIKITEQSSPVKKVQVGILAREVRASDQTDQNYYAKASKFAGVNNTYEKFESAVKSSNPAAVTIYDLKPLENNIQGLEKPRQLIRWVFEAKAGDISKVFLLGDKYVVAAVTKVNKEGYKPLADAAAIIRIEVKKQKKAEYLSKQLINASAGVSSIDAIASKLNTVVKTANGILFSSYTIQDLGAEPKLIAAASNMDPNKISSPIVGENGVYLIYVENKTKTNNQYVNTDLTKNYIERSYGARVNYETFQVLQDLADIKDNRARFY
jgi:peptidyl-prolyl cis-trans isomerase D